ncbi:MAG: hypothetical protein QM742_08290 [Aquabacterium sp.]
MLVIRNPQMRAFEEAAFAEWLMRHLHRHFPQQCQAMGPARLQQHVEASLERARSFGFDRPADLCRFVDLTMTFGADFAHDAALPWAAELLSAADIPDPGTRMDLLVAAAARHLNAHAEDPLGER